MCVCVCLCILYFWPFFPFLLCVCVCVCTVEPQLSERLGTETLSENWNLQITDVSYSWVIASYSTRLIRLYTICILHWFSFLHYSLAIHEYIKWLYLFSLYCTRSKSQTGSTVFFFSTCSESLKIVKLSIFHFTATAWPSAITSNSNSSCFSLKVFAHAKQMSLSDNLSVWINKVQIIQSPMCFTFQSNNIEHIYCVFLITHSLL